MSPDTEALQTAAIQKIRFNALVLQMAVAEMLNVAGLPRRTFALQFATDGLPEVTLFHSRSMAMSSGQEEDRSEMVPHVIESTGLNGPAEIEFKHIVVVDGVHFTAENHCTEDGDGSEGLGFFNARGLHSWPSHLGEVTACCLNSTQMDGGTFKDNFASDIGEALQVFGHSLDTSIARKGIAHMNQLLCVYEVKPHVELPTFDDVNSQGWLKLNHLALYEVKDHGGPRWDSTSSQKLCASPWIWSPDSVRMYGPVGTSQGEDNQEVLEEIPTSRNLKPEEELRAIALDADTLLDEFWTLSRAELSEMENDNEVRSEGKRHWFVLVDGEHITRVDVCASTWIEGIQLHTNLRSSRWYGGTGDQKHMLQSPDGWRVATFFGSKSGQHVRTLGVKCLPLSSSPKPHCNWPKPLPRAGKSIKFLKAVGEAYEHGPNTRFVLMPDTMGAVVIRCGEYVEAPFRVLLPEEVAANCTNPEAYNYNDHVFELFPGEKIVKVEMSSGFWVDVMRLTTTLRVSPWFGGEGGSIRPPLECPTGHNICGFHGTHGKKYSIAMENAAQPPSCSVSGSQRRNHAAQAADPNSQQAADVQQQPEHDIFGDWNLNMVVMFMLLLHFMQYAMRQPCGC
ncbi:hypothetical protein BBJ29_004407 [Phytophthora kernoviae]|uniref:Jacalin-type lectin domain-containing protein n=1 Tax=Phytophthora kernoviae TaxID=325452 RepID=A0A421FP85_9STRA|nr:hypothetical protein BBJ29_004407 [Phytophthora kernoviae]